MPMSSTKISSVSITKNEAQNIAACIDSCRQISDDIIIIDSHSTDATVEIAKQKGAQVQLIDWQGYGHAKNMGATHSTNDWILSIDADERLDNEMVETLKNIDLEKDHIYGFKRLNHVGNQAIKHGEWNPDIKFRLYYKDATSWNLSDVHEQLICGPWHKKTVIPGYLMHYSYRNAEDLVEKLDHYARLGARQMFDKTISPGVFAALKPTFRFLKSYYVKGGFLDGKLGYKIAKANADSVRKKYAYLKELLNK